MTGRGDVPFASVILPVWRSDERLDRAIAALALQTYPPHSYEVIVVDNGRPQSLSDRELPAFVRTVHEKRPGSYVARNTGLTIARGDVLAFTDADCIPAPDWIAQGAQAVCRDASIGVLAGRIDPVFENPGAPSVMELYDAATSLRQRQFVEQYRFGATANLFTKRSVIDRVGCFDGALRSGGDCEWCVRVCHAGYDLCYCDAALVQHPARRSLRQVVGRSLRVTIGTRRTLERFEHSRMTTLAYARHQLISRPQALLQLLARSGWPAPRRRKAGVLALYYYIKTLQVLERAWVASGAEPRR